MGVPLSSDEKNKTNEPTSYATVGPSSPTSSKEDELEAAETASMHPLCVCALSLSLILLYIVLVLVVMMRSKEFQTSQDLFSR